MPRHIIHKQTVTLHKSTAEGSTLLQDKVSHLFNNELEEAIEAVFDGATEYGEVIRIEKLALDLGEITPENFEQEFKTRFISELTKKIQESKSVARSGGNATLLSYSVSLLESLKYFLTNGRLPWFAGARKMPAWEEEIRTKFTNTDWQRLWDWLQNQHAENEFVTDRLILQFPDVFIFSLLRSGAENCDLKEDAELIYHDLCFFIATLSGDSGRGLRDTAWLNFFNVVFDGISFTCVLANIIDNVTPEKHEGTDIKSILKNTAWHKELKTKAISEAISEAIKNSEGQKEAGHKEHNSTDNTEPTEQDEKGKSKSSSINKKDKSKSSSINEKDKSKSSSINKKDKSQSHSINEKGKSISAAIDENERHDAAAALRKDKEASRNNDGKLDKEDFLVVYNSGIVLLNPFLKHYFEETALFNDKKFVDTDAQKRAVLLLHYLATGSSVAAEFDLTLQKVLCNMPSDEPIPNEFEITDKEMEEADNLLKAVTQHWEPLRNTSVDGLRDTFLQREGKMKQTETGWNLYIEPKTVDILIGKLPWGFSTIRLPWMKDILHVEWY